jgi:hypothetical protein
LGPRVFDALNQRLVLRGEECPLLFRSIISSRSCRSSISLFAVLRAADRSLLVMYPLCPFDCSRAAIWGCSGTLRSRSWGAGVGGNVSNEGRLV